MTGGDYDAAIALFISHGKGQLGRAAVSVKEINREAGGGHDLGAEFGKMPGLMAGVVGDGAGKGAFFYLLLDIVG